MKDDRNAKNDDESSLTHPTFIIILYGHGIKLLLQKMRINLESTEC